MLKSLVSKYRDKGILIDTNLLIGFLVGLFGTQHLRNCRATKNFTGDDFDLLNDFLGQFSKRVTTPHILTEISNLSGRLPEEMHIGFRRLFKVVIQQQLYEENCSSATIADSKLFLRVGLTDAAITLISPGEYLVLTDEFPLFGHLQKQGIDAINFNHLRQLSWRD